MIGGLRATWGIARGMSRAVGPTARQHRTPQWPRLFMRLPLTCLPGVIIRRVQPLLTPEDKVRGLRPSGSDEERRIGLDRRASAVTKRNSDDRLHQARAEQVVIQDQERKLERAVGVGLDGRG